ncbi:MAG: hypothetical protein JXR83_03155, partial [Deltaproteobacteria bacterium]|nr:hypothetical protein [Deltaproteobacteria bacterium]
MAMLFSCRWPVASRAIDLSQLIAVGERETGVGHGRALRQRALCGIAGAMFKLMPREMVFF